MWTILPGAARRSILLTAVAVSLSFAACQAQDQPAPSPAPPSPQPAYPQRVGVSAGSLLIVKKVPPEYPRKAKQNGIQGLVVLSAKISKEGKVVDLTLVSGDPLLAKAAIKAVKQWKYHPYLLPGNPVEVETQIQVNFVLATG